MASSSPSRKGSRQMPLKDRRAAPDGKGGGSLRKLKGLLGRPIGLERRDGKLHVVLTERRRQRPADEPPSLSQLCAELSARLLAHETSEVQTMRHLILVHDALERTGLDRHRGHVGAGAGEGDRAGRGAGRRGTVAAHGHADRGPAAAAHRGRPARPARDRGSRTFASATTSRCRSPTTPSSRRSTPTGPAPCPPAWCRRATATTDRARRGEPLIATGAAPSATLPPLHSGGRRGAILLLAASCAARGAGLRRLVLDRRGHGAGQPRRLHAHR